MSDTSGSQEEIEVRAYQLWEDRGRPWGTPETDWFEAEKEVGGHEPDGILSKVAREVGAALGTGVAFLKDLDVAKHPTSS